MSYQHSNVYIVRIVDTDDRGETQTWFVGPYGSTRADQTADQLESAAREAALREDPDALRDRQCYAEPLFSDEECLKVADYGRAAEGSPSAYFLVT